MARRRRLPRYKKTAIFVAGIGIAGGITAVILWPEIKKLFQTPSITMVKGTRVGDKVWNGTRWETLPASEIDPDYVDSLPYAQLLGLR